MRRQVTHAEKIGQGQALPENPSSHAQRVAYTEGYHPPHGSTDYTVQLVPGSTAARDAVSL